MSYSAVVTSGSSWLSITSGGSGGNSGAFVASYSANGTGAQRSGTIQVTASGASGSPMTITVTQGSSTGNIAAGFDCEYYPTDARMNYLIKNTNLRWCGYYLYAPSQHMDTGWLGKREYLQETLGWQIAPIYVGQQAPGYSQSDFCEPSAAQGIIDGNEAVAEMGQDAGTPEPLYFYDSATHTYKISRTVTQQGQGFALGTTVYLDWESGNAINVTGIP